MGFGGNDITRCGLIVGLGNPGSEYEGTRHNIGFALIDALLKKFPKNFEAHHGHSSRYWRGTYAGRPLLLQKPETYMNLSGEAVASLMRSEGLSPEEILVVFDDMDISLGRMRIRKKGGSGGHNGIKSIIENTGSENFPRLRMGIGKDRSRAGRDHVLSVFEDGEKEVCGKVIEAAADAVVLLLRRGADAAMNAFNSVDFAPKEESAEDEKEQN